MRIGHAISVFRGQREFHMNIIGRRRWWFLLSGTLIILSLGGLFVRQLNLSIAFEGGAVLEYPNAGGVSIQEVQETMAGFGRDDAVVQLIDGQELNVRTGTLGGQRTDVLEALADQAGIRPDEINVEEIGPQWGEQISQKALLAFLISIAMVVLYISFRFELKMAAAALAALLHDLVITAGIYALAGREVTPETVIAILTILGYSLYDTVVIFDKVKENTESQALVAKETYAGAVNMTMNQVFMRSVNTSLSTLVPIAALLFFGGDTLKDFAFALFVGVTASSYSSIFTAAPLLVVLKEREPKMTEIRQRVSRRETARPALAPVPDEEAIEERELAPAVTRTPVRRPQQARRKPKKKPRSKRKRR
jgi:preprotein translocase subunit SecF